MYSAMQKHTVEHDSMCTFNSSCFSQVRGAMWLAPEGLTYPHSLPPHIRSDNNSFKSMCIIATLQM